MRAASVLALLLPALLAPAAAHSETRDELTAQVRAGRAP